MYILFSCLLYHWTTLDFNISFFRWWLSISCLFHTVLGAVGYRGKGVVPTLHIFTNSLQSREKLKDNSSKFITKV